VTQQGIDLLDAQPIIPCDHQHVDIAGFVLLAAGKRAKDKRDHHFCGHAAQRSPQSIPQTNGANDDLFQRLINRRIRIRLIETLPVPAKDAAIRQQFQFPLHRPSSPAAAANDLPQIKRLPRPQKHHRQNRLAGAAKKNRPGIPQRNHIADDCTYFGCAEKSLRSQNGLKNSPLRTTTIEMKRLHAL